MPLKRSARITLTVLSGQDVLDIGHETARQLWNFARYCAIGHNWKVRCWRGHRQWELYRDRMPPYPGWMTMLQTLRDTDEARLLSDRCFNYTIRELDAAIRSWFSNLKTNRKARPPRHLPEGRPRQLTFEVGRNIKHLGDWTFRLAVLGSHVKKRHIFVKLHVRPGIRVRQVKLIRIQPNGTGTILYDVTPQDPPGQAIAGVDLGIVNLAAVAFQDGTSILYNGRGLLASDQWHAKRVARCKPSGWKGKGHKEHRPSPRNVTYRCKAGNIRNLIIHNLTRHIVDRCVERGVGIIVIGDLKHIRKGRDWGKVDNPKLHTWPFAEIRRQLTYKAEEAGIQVVVVSEAYTSKTCHQCGETGRRVHRGLFLCRNCDVAINADVNGAFGILNKVSPVPAYAGVGVEAILPGLPSHSVGDEISSRSPGSRGTGADAQATAKEAGRPTQIGPTWVAKFDLHNWSVRQIRCNPERKK